jgi:hypothetical protein
MLFGLTNRPATFQRYMSGLFIDALDQYLTIFVDNILITAGIKLSMSYM